MITAGRTTTAPSRPQSAEIAMFAALLAAAALATTPAFAQRGLFAPEEATGSQTRNLVTAKRHMVVAANPLAANAGREILRAGGSAVDAAIATQMVLGLVEPQSSGLGGGAFLVHWNAASKTVSTYDGRETAPAAARPDRFLSGGRPMPFRRAVKSGLSVGVPGVVAMLAEAHKTQGRLPWPKLFEPALRLAENGFPVSPRLHGLLEWQGATTFAPPARAYFFNSDGRPHPVGHLLKNPDFAATLQAIAAQGADAFYKGAIATQIAEAVQEAALPGDLTPEDLAGYRAKQRPAVCATYRSYRICGMGPPSSGATTVLGALKMIEPLNIGTTPAATLNLQALHTIAEAEKLAFADRNRYLADPDFVAIPSGLLDDAYLAARARLITPGQILANPPAGTPPGAQASIGHDGTIERTGTSHISIVDDQGNAVAMTSTIEGAFGSGLWAAGFLLNNELTDFSMAPVDSKGRAIANRIEPGKRPRSSMAPTLVFDSQGRLFAVLGSPGGSSIILYVVKSLVALIDWKLDAQQAADLINFGSRGRGFELEWPEARSIWSPASAEARTPWVWHALKLKARGHAVRFDAMTSGTHIIVQRFTEPMTRVLEGGADRRREGLAAAD